MSRISLHYQNSIAYADSMRLCTVHPMALQCLTRQTGGLSRLCNHALDVALRPGASVPAAVGDQRATSPPVHVTVCPRSVYWMAVCVSSPRSDVNDDNPKAGHAAESTVNLTQATVAESSNQSSSNTRRLLVANSTQTGHALQFPKHRKRISRLSRLPARGSPDQHIDFTCESTESS